MTTNIRTWLSLALPVVAVASFALAQEAPAEIRQERRQERRGTLREAAGEVGAAVGDVVAGAIRGGQLNDAIIAGMLIPCNQEEISLAQFALKQTQNAEVKEFAQMMIDDHQKFAAQLRRFGGVSAGPAAPEDAEIPDSAEPRRTPQVRIEADADTAEADSAAPERPRKPVAARRTADTGWNHLTVRNQIAQRCLALTQQMLQKKQGADFDKCYLGQQIVTHIGAQAQLEVLADYASPELRQILDQGIQIAKQHLTHAEKLAQNLEKSGA